MKIYVRKPNDYYGQVSSLTVINIRPISYKAYFISLRHILTTTSNHPDERIYVVRARTATDKY